MAEFQIIVGSMLGGTEYVAEACEEKLVALKHNVSLHLKPTFEQIISSNQIWLICTSTHGAGDLPDNIQEFAADLSACDQDLSSTSFIVIGVGDSNYDTFCQAAKKIESILISKGCNKILENLSLDMSLDIDPEECAQQWLNENKDLF
ncbi:MAG: FMN-binding protein MioC [Colwellia sp.]|nr:FMN-binding protein MioC [Colwellia sp.]